MAILDKTDQQQNWVEIPASTIPISKNTISKPRSRNKLKIDKSLKSLSNLDLDDVTELDVSFPAHENIKTFDYHLLLTEFEPAKRNEKPEHESRLMKRDLKVFNKTSKETLKSFEELIKTGKQVLGTFEVRDRLLIHGMCRYFGVKSWSIGQGAKIVHVQGQVDLNLSFC